MVPSVCSLISLYFVQDQQFTNISTTAMQWQTLIWIMFVRKEIPCSGTWSRMKMQWVKYQKTLLKKKINTKYSLSFLSADPSLWRVNKWGREAALLFGVLVHWQADSNEIYWRLLRKFSKQQVTSVINYLFYKYLIFAMYQKSKLAVMVISFYRQN